MEARVFVSFKPGAPLPSKIRQTQPSPVEAKAVPVEVDVIAEVAAKTRGPLSPSGGALLSAAFA